jgi:hypothetical protein
MAGDGKARPQDKFKTPYKISALCKLCTPEKKSSGHQTCYNVNCICIHHGNWTAMYAREAGLRTIPKPGDPDYKIVTDKPFCDDQPVEVK